MLNSCDIISNILTGVMFVIVSTQYTLHTESVSTFIMYKCHITYNIGHFVLIINSILDYYHTTET